MEIMGKTKHGNPITLQQIGKAVLMIFCSLLVGMGIYIFTLLATTAVTGKPPVEHMLMLLVLSLVTGAMAIVGFYGPARYAQTCLEQESEEGD